MELTKLDKTITQEISLALEKNNLLIGFRESYKKLLNNNLSKIYVCNNSREDIRLLFENCLKSGEKKINFLDISNEKLGLLSKKPFNVSVVSILKTE